ncbi:MAG TPA: DUF1819 family protein [Candidatus Aphodovivens excrementavium]|nr:DUF1819 family protein [Candidatus Aphodovivens excrementavium]
MVEGHSKQGGSPFGRGVTRRGDGSLTREQFLLRELRIVAQMRADGCPDEEILARAERENVFQYPTTRQARRAALACLARLDAMGAPLARLTAEGSLAQAAQANLYAMMRVYRLVRCFMLEEVAPRLASFDQVLSRADAGAFLERYQARFVEGGWSDATVSKLRGVLSSILAGAGMRSSARSGELNPVMVDPAVEEAVRASGNAVLLAAFDGRSVAEGV